MIADADAAAALRRAADAGPYFAIDLEPDPVLWRPFTDLLDPEVLRENVAQVRRVLQERAGTADLDDRACASIHVLGLVSRLVAPTLAAAVLARLVPALPVDGLWWRRVAGGPVPVAVSFARGLRVADTTDAATAVHELVIEASVAPLLAAFGATFRLSTQVLWGNAASAVAGAATMLGPGARALAEEVTSRGSLAGMGRWTPTGFTRNNCCLFYRIPGAGTCGDCVLVRPRVRVPDPPGAA